MVKKKSLVNTQKEKIIEQTGLQGNVVIKIVKGKKVLKETKVHNIATMELLYGMMVSLSGKSDPSRLPRFLGVGQSAQPITIDEKALKEEITITRPSLTPNIKGNPTRDITNKLSSTVYQGLIPYNKVLEATIKEIGIFGTESEDSLLARIIIPEGITLGIGQSLLVEWSFSIKNV